MALSPSEFEAEEAVSRKVHVISLIVGAVAALAGMFMVHAAASVLIGVCVGLLVQFIGEAAFRVLRRNA